MDGNDKVVELTDEQLEIVSGGVRIFSAQGFQDRVKLFEKIIGTPAKQGENK